MSINIHIITIDTRHGTDTILVRTKPSHMDLGLIENFYLKEYDLENVYVDYHEKLTLQDIPVSVKDWIKENKP